MRGKTFLFVLVFFFFSFSTLKSRTHSNLNQHVLVNSATNSPKRARPSRPTTASAPRRTRPTRACASPRAPASAAPPRPPTQGSRRRSPRGWPAPSLSRALAGWARATRGGGSRCGGLRPTGPCRSSRRRRQVRRERKEEERGARGVFEVEQKKTLLSPSLIGNLFF